MSNTTDPIYTTTYTMEDMNQVIGYLTSEYVAPLWTGQVITPDTEGEAKAFFAQFDRLAKLVQNVKSEYDKQAREQNDYHLPTFRKPVTRDRAKDLSTRPVPNF